MQTPNEKNLQSRLHFPHLKIDLYFYKQIGPEVCYQFFFNNNLLFSHNNYMPLPIHDPFSIPAMVCLLDWIAGTSQKELGEDCTADQLDWYDSMERWVLFTHTTDFDEGTKEEQAAALTFFKPGFRKYTHPADIFTLNEVVGKPSDETVYLTRVQRQNLRTLLNKNRLEEATHNKIAAAFADNFQKVKKNDRLEHIIFNGDKVTLNAKRSYKTKLRLIILHITLPY